MIEVAIMIEAQNGLNWPRWKRIVRAVEELGFVGLYRSDHFTNMNPPDKDSLELWTSLTWLATNTERLEFGPLVTPFSFRHPTLTARFATAVDDLSGGRLTLGLGAGWQEREHNNYGLDLLEPGPRFDRFAEGMEVISRLLNSKEANDFDGSFYKLEGASLLPRPARTGGPPILVGGSGRKRTLPLAAKYAVEWNTLFKTPAQLRDLNSHLDELLAAEGRQPSDVRRSVMTGCYFGETDAEVQEKIEGRGRTVQEFRDLGVVIGTPNEVVAQIGEISEVGLHRVMLQWLDIDDLDGLEALAKTVLPQVN